MIGKLSTHFPYPRLKLLKKVKSSQITEYSYYSAKYLIYITFKSPFYPHILFSKVFLCVIIFTIHLKGGHMNEQQTAPQRSDRHHTAADTRYTAHTCIGDDCTYYNNQHNSKHIYGQNKA